MLDASDAELNIVVPTGEPVDLEEVVQPAAPETSEELMRQAVTRRRRRQVRRSTAPGPAELVRAGATRAAVHRFRVEVILEAQDVRDALRLAESLGAKDVVAITRET